MKIEFKNDDLSTVINVNDDSSDAEVMIETVYDGSEAWHSFQKLPELDDFIEALTLMRDRMADKIGAPRSRAEPGFKMK